MPFFLVFFTLPETNSNSSPLKMDAWKRISFLLGQMAYLQGQAVSFTKGISFDDCWDLITDSWKHLRDGESLKKNTSYRNQGRAPPGNHDISPTLPETNIAHENPHLSW